MGQRFLRPGLLLPDGIGFPPAGRASDRPRQEIVGADISWVQQQEREGIRFSDGGRQKDIFAILRDHGFNGVRLRLFHNPRTPQGYSRGGYCDLAHTLEMAKRARAAHMDLLLDIHYSDTWADPAHQMKPAAWAKLGPKDLRQAVYRYTREVLLAFTKQHTPPRMVQIGNEITGGFLWPEGKVWERGREESFCNLLKAAIAGVRSVSPATRILLHTSSGGRNGDCVALFDLIHRHHVPFDIISVSYYPQYQGVIDNLRNNLTDLAARYPQDIVVAEYGVPDQREVRKILKALPHGKGLGSFLWEPTKWPLGHPALFDEKGVARRVINDFNPAKKREPGKR